jgi:hypothetical protein
MSHDSCDITYVSHQNMSCDLTYVSHQNMSCDLTYVSHQNMSCDITYVYQQNMSCDLTYVSHQNMWLFFNFDGCRNGLHGTSDTNSMYKGLFFVKKIRNLNKEVR